MKMVYIGIRIKKEQEYCNGAYAVDMQFCVLVVMVYDSLVS